MTKPVFLFCILVMIAGTAAYSETADERFSTVEAYFDEGRFEEARTTLEEAIELYPDDVRFYMALRNALYNLDNLNLSLKYFSRAIGLDGGNAEAYNMRAYNYISMGNFEKAMEDFNTTIYLEPGNDKYYRQRGLLFSRNSNNIAMALGDFNRAVEIDPLNFKNYRERGVF
jgi:tetratricopeptide (TPR) repeat protein